ncbi:MAG: hypothetical protein IPH20_05055 [Bacteroidales bacterium]|nr:hypothetical protein [Bacteroidales bacterium]
MVITFQQHLEGGGGGAGTTGVGGDASSGTRGTGTTLYGGNGAMALAIVLRCCRIKLRRWRFRW